MLSESEEKLNFKNHKNKNTMESQEQMNFKKSNEQQEEH